MRDRDAPEVARFRSQLRGWLAENLDEPTRALAGKGLMLEPAEVELARRWQRALDDAGWSAVSWPLEFGGRAAGVLEQAAYAEELDRAGAPGSLNPIGMANIAPAIMTWGSAEQQREMLPRMRRGDDIWCQGFSEPEAGSDLASLRTTAARDGDHYVVSGQKVWTTLAQSADWCELLVRTDPGAPKHRGLSVLIVDMRLPGVDVRPLRTLTGDAEFNEVFFTDVRVPASMLLGPEGAGWKVAMTTLNNERAGVLALSLGTRRKVTDLLRVAAEPDASGWVASEDPVVRQALMRAWLHAELLSLLGERSVADAALGRPPGPEASLGKLVWAHADEATCAAAEIALGPEAMTGPFGRSRVYSPAMSIAGGTAQVNKNIIATQVLGLPRQ